MKADTLGTSFSLSVRPRRTAISSLVAYIGSASGQCVHGRVVRADKGFGILYNDHLFRANNLGVVDHTGLDSGSELLLRLVGIHLRKRNDDGNRVGRAHENVNALELLVTSLVQTGNRPNVV